MHPRHFHATIVLRRSPLTVVLLSKTVHETAVARRPAARPRRYHDAIHDAPTTLPHYDSATTVSTSRRFIVKNRPQNRRGKETRNPPTTLLRHSHEGLTTIRGNEFSPSAPFIHPFLARFLWVIHALFTGLQWYYLSLLSRCQPLLQQWQTFLQ